MNMYQVIICFHLQYCSAPECSDGGKLDPYRCNCVNFTKSTCPDGTNEVVDSKGRCFCQEAVHPLCDAGYTLYPDVCKCKIKVPPTCPDGTYLISKDAKCFGVDDPYCPKGYRLVGCKCVREDDRECERGQLTADYCKCKDVYPPTCSGKGCSLNTDGKCSCERDGKNLSTLTLTNAYILMYLLLCSRTLISAPRRIKCYYSRRCKGRVYYVDDYADCCYQWPEDYDGDDSQSPPRTWKYLKYYSYNNQYGQCYTW